MSATAISVTTMGVRHQDSMTPDAARKPVDILFLNSYSRIAVSNRMAAWAALAHTMKTPC